MLTVSFLPRAKTVCMHSASYDHRNMSKGKGAQYLPIIIGIPTFFWKSFPQNGTFLTKVIFLSNSEGFQWHVCNGSGLPTGDANFNRHLILSQFGLAYVLVLIPVLWKPVTFLDFNYRISLFTSTLVHAASRSREAGLLYK